MTFEVIWSKRAKKDLKGLPNEVAERIIKKVDAAKDNPGHFLEDLTGRSELKLKAGDYRVFCDSNAAKKSIEVVHIDHRRRAYKRPW